VESSKNNHHLGIRDFGKELKEIIETKTEQPVVIEKSTWIRVMDWF